MTIRAITIENVKGIENRTFDLGIIPNKPSLLVAPNGFGKSSLAIAFASLRTNRIALAEEESYRGDATRLPCLTVEFIDEAGNTLRLQADATSNTIAQHLDVFVINNQVKAKGIRRNFGGQVRVSASMAIESVTLIDTIPQRQQFGYSCTTERRSFGVNGKMLPNIATLFDNRSFIDRLSDMCPVLDQLQLQRTQRTTAQFRNQANAQNGSAAVLQGWVAADKLHDLDNIQPLRTIAELILHTNSGITSRELAYLAALQISALYGRDRARFRAACKYSNYLLEREQYTEMLAAFNTSWCAITPREQDGSLVVEFPPAHHISNGQRDVLSFIALLHRARRKLRRPNSILVIDEVFDYLDDANLVAVQYYVSQFIETYHSEGRRIYPLILTHLNPYYFRNFAFSKQKVYFLDRRDITPDANLVKLLRLREDPDIKDDVSKHLLHFHPGQINRRAEFRALGLKETWGENDAFDRFIDQEIVKYRNGDQAYDPLAICCAVRKRVEKLIYDKLATDQHKDEFLDIHMTRGKLEYAEGAGVVVPEYYYLLGIVYNDALHWRDNPNYVSSIASKLENATLANLIKQLY